MKIYFDAPSSVEEIRERLGQFVGLFVHVHIPHDSGGCSMYGYLLYDRYGNLGLYGEGLPRGINPGVFDQQLAEMFFYNIDGTRRPERQVAIKEIPYDEDLYCSESFAACREYLDADRKVRELLGV